MVSVCTKVPQGLKCLRCTATAAVFKVQVHPEGASTFGFGQLSLDEETPKYAVITHTDFL